MKRILFFIPLLLVVFFASCIKDPAPNPEADILTFTYPEKYLRSKTEITNDAVILYPNANAEIVKDSIKITVTQGATWQFKELQEKNTGELFGIEVTSEDRNSVKTYIIRQVGVSLPGIFLLDEWVKVDNTKNYENPKDGDIQWASGNAGIAVLWGAKPASDFPVRKTTESNTGTYAAELRSLAGPAMINPCVAGSIFIGNFDPSKALTDKLKTTQFGVPYSEGKPSKLTGYYKYKQGEEGYTYQKGYDNNGLPIWAIDENRPDSCDIYAVLYKVDEHNPCLYGDNIKDSPNIIAKAQITERGSTSGDGFIHFEVDFVYDGYKTPFKKEELLNNQYKITLVCTSSTRGAFSEGRIGSRLIVDDLQIIATPADQF